MPSGNSVCSRARFEYRPELDILRFFAFFFVFFCHAADNSIPEAKLTSYGIPPMIAVAFKGFIRGGGYGVDLFFCLSAYLITALLLKERQETGKLEIRQFYLRRLLRIWPLYYFMIIAAVACTFVDPLQEFGLRYVVAFLFFVGNWSFGLFGWPYSIATPLWSVSVEEQFYLLWPPLVARLQRRQIIWTAVALIIAANCTRLAGFLNHETTLHMWGNTVAHLDTIAAGILLGVVFGQNTPQIATGVRALLITAGVISFAAQYALKPSETLTASAILLGYPAIAVGCACILIGFLGSSIRSPSLQYLGKISYGLYALHLLCIALVDRALQKHAGGGLYWIALLGGGLILTIAASAVSYAILERPFLLLKRRYTVVESRAA